jgi:hypothetical protein
MECRLQLAPESVLTAPSSPTPGAFDAVNSRAEFVGSMTIVPSAWLPGVRLTLTFGKIDAKSRRGSKVSNCDIGSARTEAGAFTSPFP